jgi:hypothetical protein
MARNQDLACLRKTLHCTLFRAEYVTPTSHLDFGLPWAVELPIEFETVPAPVHTAYYFWAKYRAENLPLKDEQSVLFHFCQHPRFTAVQQDRRSTYLQF